jgi:hypothetical protein
VILGIAAAITSATITINIENGKTSATITYSQETATPELTDGLSDIEYGQGEIKIDGEEIKTVEAVESNGPVTEVNNPECPEGEECGQGAYVPTLDISSPQAFANATLGQCIDVDGYYGAQCWDLVAAMHYQYTGKVLTTCGTGAAKGVIADGCWQQNYTPDKYRMIWDPNQIVAGAHVYFGSGVYGHEGIALGTTNNGYITLLGQNQGGGYCASGGAATNIINISTRDFIGAAMPLIWDAPAPAPEPEPAVDTCSRIDVVEGDTLGDIMLRCEGEVKWGADMDAYAQSWVSETTGNTVFFGWTHGTGYGLYAGDTIIRK